MKTYQGSCHCGQVKFEADIDLSQGTTKCNCSFCRKTRWWGIHIKPEQFRPLSEPEALKDYQFGSFVAHHVFCQNCGVRTFERGELEFLGGKYIAVNLACLDNLDPEELVAAPVTYLDGLSDSWAPIEGEIRHL